MDSVTNISCRVCLNLEDIMVYIYDEVEDMQSDLSYALELCGGIRVYKDDTYPDYLCRECTNELLIAVRFRKKCARTQEIFKQPPIAFAMEKHFLEADQIKEPIDISPTQDPDGLSFFGGNSCYGSLDKQQLIKESTAQEYINVSPSAEVSADDHLKTDTEPNYEIYDDMILYDTNNTANRVCANEKVGIQTRRMGPLEDNNNINTTATGMNLRFICDSCGAAFVHPLNLKRHLEKLHSGTIFSCKTCSYCFSSRANYENHLRVCDYVEPEGNDRNKQVSIKRQSHSCKSCPHCGMRTQSSFALDMHIRTHTGERPFQCEYCSNSFKTQSSLKTHLDRHAGVPKYSCEICNKAFYETSNLKTHIRTHTGEKPHECAICKKRFTRVSLLQLHLRTHTGEKPYQCNICDRRFAQSGDLKYHERTHTGERLFGCSICPKAFIKRSALKGHLQKHASLDMFVGMNQSFTTSGHNGKILENITLGTVFENPRNNCDVGIDDL